MDRNRGKDIWIFFFFLISIMILCYYFSVVAYAEIFPSMVDVSRVVEIEDVKCLNDLLYRCPDWDTNIEKTPEELKKVFIGWLLYDSGTKFAIHLPKVYAFMDFKGIPREFLEVYLSGFLDKQGELEGGINYIEIIRTEEDIYNVWSDGIVSGRSDRLFAGNTMNSVIIFEDAVRRPTFFYNIINRYDLTLSFKRGLIESYKNYLVIMGAK